MEADWSLGYWPWWFSIFLAIQADHPAKFFMRFLSKRLRFLADAAITCAAFRQRLGLPGSMTPLRLSLVVGLLLDMIYNLPG
jgi:hypothetical protein